MRNTDKILARKKKKDEDDEPDCFFQTRFLRERS